MQYNICRTTFTQLESVGTTTNTRIVLNIPKTFLLKSSYTKKKFLLNNPTQEEKVIEKFQLKRILPLLLSFEIHSTPPTPLPQPYHCDKDVTGYVCPLSDYSYMQQGSTWYILFYSDHMKTFAPHRSNETDN